MTRITLAIIIAAVVGTTVHAADEPKIVSKSREKLATKIDVDFKDTRLEDCVQEIEKMTELKFYYGPGVSKNQAVSYAAKDKPAKDVLHEMFKDRGLGYIIHRKEKEGDRYEGWIQIVQGDERGDDKKTTAAAKPAAKTPAKSPPKSDTPAKASDTDDEKNEKLAAAKLRQAKTFLEDGQKTDAVEFCEQIIKRYPKTKAAGEAKELLEKLKK